MPTIDDIAEELQFADDQMRLEILLDYAGRLPPLPEAYVPLRDAGLNMVHECQSPVFLTARVEDDRVRIYADVPEEAPMARSFTAMLVEAFDGATPDEHAAAPPDLLHHHGLTGQLGMQRTRGLSAIYARLRHEVAEAEDGSG